MLPEKVMGQGLIGSGAGPAAVAVRDPGTIEVADILDAALAGGVRARMDATWRNNSRAAFMKAARQMRIGGMLLHALPAAVQAVSWPIMEGLVPLQKLGVFSKLMEFQLEQMPPNAPRELVRQVALETWKSVEDRLGEMTKDDLLWNNMLRDIGLLTFQSLTWNLGSGRWFSGAARDVQYLLKPGQRETSGGEKFDRARFSTRLAAALMLLPARAWIGVIWNYVMTGHGPTSIRDMFFIPSGRKNPDGTEERFMVPGYHKDLFNLYRSPVTTLTHKLNPAVSTLIDELSNEDFYRNMVWNPDDPAWKKWEQRIEFAAKAFIPFGVKYSAQEAAHGQGTARSAAPLLGITPAPRWAVRSDAANRMAELRARHGGASLTPEEVALSDLRHGLLERLRRQEPGAVEEARGAVHRKEITEGQYRNLIAQAREPSSAAAFKSLTLAEAEDVFARDKTPEEGRLWTPILAAKRRGIGGPRGPQPPSRPRAW